MSDKIYCGSGKIINTKYGELTKISFTTKDIEILKENLVNGWVNLDLKEKQNKVEGKPTHYLQVDTWKRDNQSGYTQDQEDQMQSEEHHKRMAATTADPNDDLPF